jgi:hypothetical protein
VLSTRLTDGAKDAGRSGMDSYPPGVFSALYFMTCNALTGVESSAMPSALRSGQRCGHRVGAAGS